MKKKNNIEKPVVDRQYVIAPEPAVYGATLAPAADQTVKFVYTTDLTKVGTAPDGALVFYADANGGGAVYAGNSLVSSKILDVTATQKTDATTGVQTVTVTYLDGTTKTSKSFEAVNDAAVKEYLKTRDTSISALEAYAKADNVTAVENSAVTVAKTEGATGNTYAVGLNVDGKTVTIDANNKLASGLKIALVAGKAASEGNTGTKSQIQLQDNAGNIIGKGIDVDDIATSGIFKTATYDDSTGILTFEFDQSDGTVKTVDADLRKLIDINDILVQEESKKYVEVTATIPAQGDTTDTGNYTIHVLTADPSAATSTVTGLADAYQVKSYVDAHVTEEIGKLDVAETTVESADKHVSVKYSETDGKVTVAEVSTADIASAATLTALDTYVKGDADAEGNGGIEKRVKSLEQHNADADFASTATGTSDFVTITVGEGKDGKLLDASTSVSIVLGDYETGDAHKNGIATTDATKTYVDAAITSANKSAVEALDATVSTDKAAEGETTATVNDYVHVTVTEEDGKLTEVTASADVAADADAIGKATETTKKLATDNAVKTYVDKQVKDGLKWQIL